MLEGDFMATKPQADEKQGRCCVDDIKELRKGESVPQPGST